MADPRVAVVIPVHKQPSLAVEAIESVLRQRTSFDYRVVAVNDGCPFAETDAVCRAYARAYPDRFVYVRRKNGGLSAARNTGVDTALGAWPTVEAVQFLDADDWLGPCALEKAYQALWANPGCDWAYPNVRRFDSDREYFDTAGPWSVLELTGANFLVCASMLRRSLFERGLRYDEDMRLGYEDWDMWLQGAAAGLRGCHVPDMDFGYRKRAESMVSGSNRNHEAILSYMRRKHAGLWGVRQALRMEHDELPRYAVWLTDTRRVAFATDVNLLERSVPDEQLGMLLFRSQHCPNRDRFPLRLVVTSEEFLRAARAGRYAAGLLWHLQARLEDTKTSVAAAHVETRPQPDVLLQVLPRPTGEEGRPRRAALAVVTTEYLRELLLDGTGEEWRGLTTGPHPRLYHTRIRHGRPDAYETFPANALDQLSALVQERGPAYRQLPMRRTFGGRMHTRFVGDSCEIVRQRCGVGPLYPLLPDPRQLQVGYVVPVCDFGGAERVTLNLARESRRYGWAPHLFVVGTGSARLLSEFRDTFESVTIADTWELWRPDTLAGLLGTMDVVVNNNCAYLNDSLSGLRRVGVKTLTHLHSITLTHLGVPCGQPLEALRYEHCLDGVIVISRKLWRWCVASGIPAEKMVLCPNAPSFEVSEALVDTTMTERAERRPSDPLRVLFISRFDSEKGLDRLLPLIAESRRRRLPLEWRVVGRPVLGGEPVDLTPIRPLIRPPALSTSALSRYYRWADVVIMLSRYEGVPLTILEAQRFGGVVLSTNVGAIDELVEEGRTGFLFCNDMQTPDLVDAMLDRLGDLQADRGRLLAFAQAAVDARREATWALSFRALARAVEAMLPNHGGSRG